MRHAVYASAGTLFWAALLAVYLNTRITYAAADDASVNSKAEDGSSQVESGMSKRDWNSKNLRMWGKRGWESLHGGWGLKRDDNSWGSNNYDPSAADKRAWQNLQGGWGKRYVPDDYAIAQLAALLQEQHQLDPEMSVEYYSDEDIEPNEVDKRGWREFNGGWGKRAAGADTWKHFRGSWGKREPAWHNLKGIWGKRSVYPDRIAE